MAPLTIIPESTSIRLESLLISFGIVTVRPTATIPPAKALICIAAAEKAKRIATAAPTQAPEDTPRNSGETRGFLKIP